MMEHYQNLIKQVNQSKACNQPQSVGLLTPRGNDIIYRQSGLGMQYGEGNQEEVPIGSGEYNCMGRLVRLSLMSLMSLPRDASRFLVSVSFIAANSTGQSPLSG
jgi:hypothetical protein